MAWKQVSEMTAQEVILEAESLAGYAETCREIQQGINSKECIRFKQCLERMRNEQLDSPAFCTDLDQRFNGWR